MALRGRVWAVYTSTRRARRERERDGQRTETGTRPSVASRGLPNRAGITAVSPSAAIQIPDPHMQIA